MGSLCGVECQNCPTKEECRGCSATCGSPFGGRCIAAEYIKTGGKQAYQLFKKMLLCEVNEALDSLALPRAKKLEEIRGSFLNLSYPLPNGESVRFLKDDQIYLATQIELSDRGVCYGVVADMGFLLIAGYSVDGSLPELVLYRRR